MKRLPFVGALVLLLVALTAPAVSAASPILDVSQQKGSSAFAGTKSCTPDSPDIGDTTCTFSFVDMFDGRSRVNGVLSRGPALCANADTVVFDVSAQTETDTFRSGCSETASVSIAKSLASASGIGSVPTQSGTCTFDTNTGIGSCTDPVAGAPIDINVQWTGIPPVFKSTFRERDQFGGCSNTYYNKGTNSEATVAGTFDGAPASFDFGQLSSGTSKSTFSCH